LANQLRGRKSPTSRVLRTLSICHDRLPWVGMSTPKPSPAAPSKALRLESLQDAADRLGVSVDTIRRLISDGKVTGYRLGRRILRVCPEEVDQAFEVTTAWARKPRRTRQAALVG